MSNELESDSDSAMVVCTVVITLRLLCRWWRFKVTTIGADGVQVGYYETDTESPSSTNPQ
jgi:hypothetical protein